MPIPNTDDDLDFPTVTVSEPDVPKHLIPNEQMIRNFRINSGLPADKFINVGYQGLYHRD